ncbi:MAG: class I SAM-dependent methyltransferase [Candidatus Cloacimonetes bacterium]|nr:class I SAM-dependent methyltransferase [Candidatus Cloacimonadota bacterium]MCK9335707.1 class I SAM-dependent methyltransferase [Candidatus Cloacimonadota bacterium]MDD3096186.1 class I SAM-dependent methyltransferase [Candidatus Cloacimonadota bacterium]
MKDVFKILNQIDGGIVLDAATGRGEFIHILKQNLRSYSQIIGIDVSERSVEYASALFPENDVEIYRMNLESLVFEDSHFDTVCISNSLHHFENLELVLAELYRVLKPGGTFILTEMYADGKQSSAQQTHILMHHWVAKVDMLCGIYHAPTFSKDEISTVIKRLKLQKPQLVDFYVAIDDPKNPKTRATLIKSCQETLKRIEPIPENQALIGEGEALIKRIAEIGYASASRVMIISHKAKGDK